MALLQHRRQLLRESQAPSDDVDVRPALLATLFASPASLAVASITGSTVALLVAGYSDDPWLRTIAFAIPIVGLLRVVHVLIVGSKLKTGSSTASTELTYQLGAWVYALLLGLLTFFALTRVDSPALQLFAAANSTGYAAGICARNAARPVIAIGQLALAALPFTAALFTMSDWIYSALGVMNLLFIAGMAEVTLTSHKSMRSALEAGKAKEVKWRETLDRIPQMVWSTDSEGVADYNSRQWKIFSGVELSGAGSAARIDLVHPEDRARMLAKWRRCLRSGRDYEAEYRLRNAAGEYRWVLSRGRANVDSSGKPVRWFGTCTDIHEHVIAREALKSSEALKRGILEASADCVSFLDVNGNVLFVNQATLDTYGLDNDAPLLDRPWGELLPKEFHHGRDSALAAAQKGDIGRLSVSLPGPGGGVRWMESLAAPVRGSEGEIVNFVVTSRDMTHQKSIEEQVRWSAAHDSLTNLPNRALFQQRLEDATARARAGGAPFALLLLDIDHFKQVNDTLGHDAGDCLLVTAAARLRDSLRDEDFVARLGGDEFAIIIGNVRHSAEVTAVAEKIFASLRRPWHHAGRLGDCRLSIGASIFLQGDRADGDTGELTSRLLKDADIALYNAKANGRGQLSIFSAGMRDEIQKRSSMIALAKTAIDDDLIIPHYQPKVHLKTGKVIGFEALLRWDHPTRGVQLPGSISAAFEDLELAAQISDRIISRAIADMRVWLREGVDFGHVALNAAAADFRSSRFADRLLEQLDANSIPHQCVQVEVTETVFLGRGAEYVERALKTLSANGVRIALDDFGTGYASLSHLKHFPVDILKIDRSFVRDLDDPDDAAIIGAVVNLGHSLNLEVVAEGIENKSQEASLLAQGCEIGQGFLYGKAASERRVRDILAGGSSRVRAAA